MQHTTISVHGLIYSFTLTPHPPTTSVTPSSVTTSIDIVLTNEHEISCCWKLTAVNQDTGKVYEIQTDEDMINKNVIGKENKKGLVVEAGIVKDIVWDALSEKKKKVTKSCYFMKPKNSYEDYISSVTENQGKEKSEEGDVMVLKIEWRQAYVESPHLFWLVLESVDDSDKSPCLKSTVEVLRTKVENLQVQNQQLEEKMQHISWRLNHKEREITELYRMNRELSEKIDSKK
eukprot:TRINITY_DN10386_c0_g1_i1.p1 TRINITY_DN10386_c0_g1~~TRINITY_DN10386_c0_g1_i1.p1  ORF type:complete len:232 (-),score=58.42 TRINITY_DN10386_c0_g1_i1:66-761(-)